MRHGLAMMRLLPLRKCFAMALPAGLRASIGSSRDIYGVTLPKHRSGVRDQELADKSFAMQRLVTPIFRRARGICAATERGNAEDSEPKNVLQGVASGACENTPRYSVRAISGLSCRSARPTRQCLHCSGFQLAAT